MPEDEFQLAPKRKPIWDEIDLSEKDPDAQMTFEELAALFDVGEGTVKGWGNPAEIATQEAKGNKNIFPDTQPNGFGTRYIPPTYGDVWAWLQAEMKDGVTGGTVAKSSGRDFMTSEEVLDYLDTSPATFQKWIDEGKLWGQDLSEDIWWHEKTHGENIKWESVPAWKIDVGSVRSLVASTAYLQPRVADKELPEGVSFPVEDAGLGIVTWGGIRAGEGEELAPTRDIYAEAMERAAEEERAKTEKKKVADLMREWGITSSKVYGIIKAMPQEYWSRPGKSGKGAYYANPQALRAALIDAGILEGTADVLEEAEVEEILPFRMTDTNGIAQMFGWFKPDGSYDLQKVYKFIAAYPEVDPDHKQGQREIDTHDLGGVLQGIIDIEGDMSREEMSEFLFPTFDAEKWRTVDQYSSDIGFPESALEENIENGNVVNIQRLGNDIEVLTFDTGLVVRIQYKEDGGVLRKWIDGRSVTNYDPFTKEMYNPSPATPSPGTPASMADVDEESDIEKWWKEKSNAPMPEEFKTSYVKEFLEDVYDWDEPQINSFMSKQDESKLDWTDGGQNVYDLDSVVDAIPDYLHLLEMPTSLEIAQVLNWKTPSGKWDTGRVGAEVNDPDSLLYMEGREPGQPIKVEREQLDSFADQYFTEQSAHAWSPTMERSVFRDYLKENYERTFAEEGIDTSGTNRNPDAYWDRLVETYKDYSGPEMIGGAYQYEAGVELTSFVGSMIDASSAVSKNKAAFDLSYYYETPAQAADAVDALKRSTDVFGDEYISRETLNAAMFELAETAEFHPGTTWDTKTAAEFLGISPSVLTQYIEEGYKDPAGNVVGKVKAERDNPFIPSSPWNIDVGSIMELNEWLEPRREWVPTSEFSQHLQDTKGWSEKVALKYMSEQSTLFNEGAEGTPRMDRNAWLPSAFDEGVRYDAYTNEFYAPEEVIPSPWDDPNAWGWGEAELFNNLVQSGASREDARTFVNKLDGWAKKGLVHREKDSSGHWKYIFDDRSDMEMLKDEATGLPWIREETKWAPDPQGVGGTDIPPGMFQEDDGTAAAASEIAFELLEKFLGVPSPASPSPATPAAVEDAPKLAPRGPGWSDVGTAEESERRWYSESEIIEFLMKEGTVDEDGIHHKLRRSTAEDIVANWKQGGALVAEGNEGELGYFLKEDAKQYDMVHEWYLEEIPNAGVVQQNITVEAVLDGDTVRLSNGESVRILGIDTKEFGQPGWEAGTEAMQAFIDLYGNEAVPLQLEWTGMDEGHVNPNIKWTPRILGDLVAPLPDGGQIRYTDFARQYLADNPGRSAAEPENYTATTYLNRFRTAAYNGNIISAEEAMEDVRALNLSDEDWHDRGFAAPGEETDDYVSMEEFLDTSKTRSQVERYEELYYETNPDAVEEKAALVADLAEKGIDALEAVTGESEFGPWGGGGYDFGMDISPEYTSPGLEFYTANNVDPSDKIRYPDRLAGTGEGIGSEFAQWLNLIQSDKEYDQIRAKEIQRDWREAGIQDIYQRATPYQLQQITETGTKQGNWAGKVGLQAGYWYEPMPEKGGVWPFKYVTDETRDEWGEAATWFTPAYEYTMDPVTGKVKRETVGYTGEAVDIVEDNLRFIAGIFLYSGARAKFKEGMGYGLRVLPETWRGWAIKIGIKHSDTAKEVLGKLDKFWDTGNAKELAALQRQLNTEIDMVEAGKLLDENAIIGLEMAGNPDLKALGEQARATQLDLINAGVDISDPYAINKAADDLVRYERAIANDLYLNPDAEISSRLQGFYDNAKLEAERLGITNELLDPLRERSTLGMSGQNVGARRIDGELYWVDTSTGEVLDKYSTILGEVEGAGAVVPPTGLAQPPTYTKGRIVEGGIKLPDGVVIQVPESKLADLGKMNDIVDIPPQIVLPDGRVVDTVGWDEAWDSIMRWADDEQALEDIFAGWEGEGPSASRLDDTISGLRNEADSLAGKAMSETSTGFPLHSGMASLNAEDMARNLRETADMLEAGYMPTDGQMEMLRVYGKTDLIDTIEAARPNLKVGSIDDAMAELAEQAADVGNLARIEDLRLGGLERDILYYAENPQFLTVDELNRLDRTVSDLRPYMSDEKWVIFQEDMGGFDDFLSGGSAVQPQSVVGKAADLEASTSQWADDIYWALESGEVDLDELARLSPDTAPVIEAWKRGDIGSAEDVGSVLSESRPFGIVEGGAEVAGVVDEAAGAGKVAGVLEDTADFGDSMLRFGLNDTPASALESISNYKATNFSGGLSTADASTWNIYKNRITDALDRYAPEKIEDFRASVSAYEAGSRPSVGGMDDVDFWLGDIDMTQPGKAWVSEVGQPYGTWVESSADVGKVSDDIVKLSDEGFDLLDDAAKAALNSGEADALVKGANSIDEVVDGLKGMSTSAGDVFDKAADAAKGFGDISAFRKFLGGGLKVVDFVSIIGMIDADDVGAAGEFLADQTMAGGGEAPFGKVGEILWGGGVAEGPTPNVPPSLQERIPAGYISLSPEEEQLGIDQGWWTEQDLLESKGNALAAADSLYGPGWDYGEVAISGALIPVHDNPITALIGLVTKRPTSRGEVIQQLRDGTLKLDVETGDIIQVTEGGYEIERYSDLAGHLGAFPDPFAPTAAGEERPTGVGGVLGALIGIGTGRIEDTLGLIPQPPISPDIPTPTPTEGEPFVFDFGDGEVFEFPSAEVPTLTPGVPATPSPGTPSRTSFADVSPETIPGGISPPPSGLPSPEIDFDEAVGVTRDAYGGLALDAEKWRRWDGTDRGLGKVSVGGEWYEVRPDAQLDMQDAEWRYANEDAIGVYRREVGIFQPEDGMEDAIDAVSKHFIRMISPGSPSPAATPESQLAPGAPKETVGGILEDVIILGKAGIDIPSGTAQDTVHQWAQAVKLDREVPAEQKAGHSMPDYDPSQLSQIGRGTEAALLEHFGLPLPEDVEQDADYEYGKRNAIDTLKVFDNVSDAVVYLSEGLTMYDTVDWEKGYIQGITMFTNIPVAQFDTQKALESLNVTPENASKLELRGTLAGFLEQGLFGQGNRELVQGQKEYWYDTLSPDYEGGDTNVGSDLGVDPEGAAIGTWGGIRGEEAKLAPAAPGVSPASPSPGGYEPSSPEDIAFADMLNQGMSTKEAQKAMREQAVKTGPREVGELRPIAESERAVLAEGFMLAPKYQEHWGNLEDAFEGRDEDEELTWEELSDVVGVGKSTMQGWWRDSEDLENPDFPITQPGGRGSPYTLPTVGDVIAWGKGRAGLEPEPGVDTGPGPGIWPESPDPYGPQEFERAVVASVPEGWLSTEQVARDTGLPKDVIVGWPTHGMPAADVGAIDPRYAVYVKKKVYFDPEGVNYYIEAINRAGGSRGIRPGIEPYQEDFNSSLLSQVINDELGTEYSGSKITGLIKNAAENDPDNYYKDSSGSWRATQTGADEIIAKLQMEEGVDVSQVRKPLDRPGEKVAGLSDIISEARDIEPTETKKIDYFTSAELEEVTGLKASQISSAISRGELEAVKVGGKWRIDIESANRFKMKADIVTSGALIAPRIGELAESGTIDYFTSAELEEVTGLKASQISSAITSGELEAEKVGGKWQIDIESANRFKMKADIATSGVILAPRVGEGAGFGDVTFFTPSNLSDLYIAAGLDISSSKITSAIKSGELKARSFRGKWQIDVDSANKYMLKKEIEKTGAITAPRTTDYPELTEQERADIAATIKPAEGGVIGWIPSKDAGETLGISSAAAINLAKSGRVEGTQVGGQWFIKAEGLEDLGLTLELERQGLVKEDYQWKGYYTESEASKVTGLSRQEINALAWTGEIDQLEPDEDGNLRLNLESVNVLIPEERETSIIQDIIKIARDIEPITPQDDVDRFLTSSEAGVRLGKSKSEVEEMVFNKELEGVIVDGSYKVDPKSVTEMLGGVRDTSLIQDIIGIVADPETISPEQIEQPTWVSPTEAGKTLGKSTAEIKTMIDNKEIDAVNVAGEWQLDRESVETLRGEPRETSLIQDIIGIVRDPQMIVPEQPTWIPYADSAKELDISTKKLSDLLADGVIKGEKVGGTWQVDAKSIDEYKLEQGLLAKGFGEEETEDWRTWDDAKIQGARSVVSDIQNMGANLYGDVDIASLKFKYSLVSQLGNDVPDEELTETQRGAKAAIAAALSFTEDLGFEGATGGIPSSALQTYSDDFAVSMEESFGSERLDRPSILDIIEVARDIKPVPAQEMKDFLTTKELKALLKEDYGFSDVDMAKVSTSYLKNAGVSDRRGDARPSGATYEWSMDSINKAFGLSTVEGKGQIPSVRPRITQPTFEEKPVEEWFQGTTPDFAPSPATPSRLPGTIDTGARDQWFADYINRSVELGVPLITATKKAMFAMQSGDYTLPTVGGAAVGTWGGIRGEEGMPMRDLAPTYNPPTQREEAAPVQPPSWLDQFLGKPGVEVPTWETGLEQDRDKKKNPLNLF